MPNDNESNESNDNESNDPQAALVRRFGVDPNSDKKMQEWINANASTHRLQHVETLSGPTGTVATRVYLAR